MYRATTSQYCRNIDNQTDKMITLIVKALKNTPSKDQRYAFGDYKGVGFSNINEPKSAFYIKVENDLETYLSSTPLDFDMHLRRDEGYGLLSKLKFNDGTTLEQVLEARRINPELYKDKIAEIKSFKGQSFINDYFVSTTADPQGAFQCPVTWDLHVCKGVGATYLDIIGLASEGEILLNRNLKYTIIDIDPDFPLKIVAKVENQD